MEAKTKLSFSVDKIEFLEEVNKFKFAKARIYAFATGKNAHDKVVSEQTLKDRAVSILSVPLVWKYSSLYNDASGHDIEEIPCGFVPQEPEANLSFERGEDGRLWLTVTALIWKLYSGKILDIFKRTDGKKGVSVEMAVFETKEVPEGEEIIDFAFTAITVLGERTHSAVPLARAEITQFSADKQEYEKQIQKYSTIDFTIPDTIKQTIKSAIPLGGTSVAQSNAKYLIGNDTITPEKLQNIIKYFSKHTEKDINYQLCGGDECLQWAKNLIGEMERKDKEIAEVKKENIAIDNFAKKEVDGMREKTNMEVKFSLNSAQIIELFETNLANYKYKNGDYEYRKYWVSAFDDEYVYVYNNENSCMERMKYTYIDSIVNVDINSAEEVISAGYMPVKKADEGKVEFCKTPEMFAKIKEFCDNVKFSKDEKEFCKYTVLDYCDKYAYCYDAEEKKVFAIPYTYCNDKFETNVEGKKKAKVKMSFAIFADGEPEEDDFAVMMSVFTTDANIEAVAQVARSAKETEGDKAIIAETNAKLETMQANFSALETERNQLKADNTTLQEFKDNTLRQEKDSKIAFAISEVSGTMPQEKIDEWKGKVETFASIDLWVNAVMADAFTYSKGNGKSEGFKRMQLPWTNENPKKGLWGKQF